MSMTKTAEDVALDIGRMSDDEFHALVDLVCASARGEDGNAPDRAMICMGLGGAWTKLPSSALARKAT
jgi:hypothetical protein